MTIKEVIETINIAIAEVEWDYPMDYTVAFEEAIKALEKQMHNCGNCRHAKHSSYNNITYCHNLSRVMLSRNCCRNWEQEDV